MAEDRNKSRDPRTIRRSSSESQREGKDINGGDGHGKAHSKRNYKLLIDPAIKKGHQKIYRFDGVFPGQPPVIPRDPRPPRTKLWTTTVADLPIPRFKVDKYYVGALPETTIRFGCLNDNINRQFLRELCSKFGKIEECKVYYDLKSKKHLGTGKITFSTTSAARQALSELDGSSVMGNIIRVSIDRKKQAHHNSLHGTRPGHGSKDPREHRDPRRLSSGASQSVLPTPSPSQCSPSVESTPPTPLVSGMHRPHPVANLKPTLQLRRGSSHDSDLNALESPASICSASFNSASFEPISPPPPGKFRLLDNDSASLPPPPPPGKGSSLPPPPNLPPPPPPAKQEIYEDISPTATFDDMKKSPVPEVSTNVKDSVADSANSTFVQAHLLGLKIACGVESKDSKTEDKLGSPNTHSAEQRRNEQIHQHEHTRSNSQQTKANRKDEKHNSAARIDTSTARLDKIRNRSDRPLSSEVSPLHSHKYPSHRDRDSSRTPYNPNMTERTSLTPRDVSPGMTPASKARPTLDIHNQSKEPNDLGLSSSATPISNTLNESVYEEISDSDDDGKNTANSIQGVTLKNLQVEDISPANSPVTKNVSNGMSLTAVPPSTNQNMDLSKNEMMKDGDQVENEDDDDAMSLSSISSNDESALVLNTPVTKVNLPVAVSSSASFHQMPFSNSAQQFPPARQSINMARPPGPPSNITRPSNRHGPSNIPGPPPPSLNIPPQSRMNIAPPPPINLARPPPVNVHQAPPLNVHQAPQNQMMRPSHHLPPPPRVNIHVPPPRMTYNQNIRNPYAQPPSQRPQMGASQPSISSFSQRSSNNAGGFIGSYSRPYSGFIPGNYPSYRDYNLAQGRRIPEIVKEIPYEERVRDASNLKTKKDLKMVLHRDLIKRLVEHSGFAALEAWWDNQTRKLSGSNTSRPARPASLAHSHMSQLTTANVGSPSSSMTSSLLSSLFGRVQQATPSSSLSSPSSHNAMQKIPSFRINRMPQGRPVGREPLTKRLKREALERGAEVENKRKRVDDKPVSEESESESESDSEVERSLLASTRPVVKSGASLYRTIYESSAEEEDSEKEEIDKEVKPKTSDEEDDDKKFQELIEEEKLKKERLKQPEVDQKSQEDEDMATEDDEEEEEESMSEDEEEATDEEDASDEEEASDGDEAEDEESSEEEDEEEEDADSEWESSGAEEAVKEVIKETEIRLEQFKEKSLKQRKQEMDRLEHDRRVEEYLKRTYEPRTKAKENYKEKKRDSLLIDKENEKSLVNQRKAKNDMKVSENDKIVEQSLVRKEAVVLERVVFEEKKVKQDLVKNREKENQSTVIEETIEETEIVSKETELDTSDIKDEVISEEVIKVEPEEPIEKVFNEHCYASFNSGFEKENLESTKKEIEITKLKNDRKSPSPIIEVVEEVEDEKEFYVKKEPEPKPVFPMRSIEDENISVWNILQHGIDKEDLEYMKTAFENLESFGSDVVKDLHWANHPETFLQTKQKKIKGEPNLRVHKTGCARSEGYYKIPFSEKVQYLSSVMRQLEVADQKVEQDTDGSKHKQQSRDNRAIQRRLVSSFVNDDFGDLVKFNKLKTRKKGLKFAKSGIHNWGLFTCEPIAAEEMVIEYVGEIVRSVIADAREKHYEQTGIGSSYLFRLDAETVIDATKVGNNARFINHSCAPNCYAKIINVENEKKIVIYSKTDIKLNDEITYDYKFPIEDEKIKCLCGTPQCRGTLN